MITDGSGRLGALRIETGTHRSRTSRPAIHQEVGAWAGAATDP
jgi:hypothetical protein